jgi:hypothetical protein
MGDSLSPEGKQIEGLEKEILEIKQMTMENRDALLGKVGCPGVLTTLALFEGRMQALETLTSNHLKHLNEKFDLMMLNRDMLQAARDKDKVNWSDILKEWAKPVITAIAVAIILAILSRSGIIN